VVEVAGILPDGRLIPSTSIGNNKTWLDLADKVILEVNSTQPLGLDGMHDIYYGTALPPNRQPIPLTQAGRPHWRAVFARGPGQGGGGGGNPCAGSAGAF
jgi:acyl-CoA hydrolase